MIGIVNAQAMREVYDLQGVSHLVFSSAEHLKE